MDEKLEEAILERTESPGWVTTRGILQDPAGESDREMHGAVEEAMISLQQKGKVKLWTLIMHQDGSRLMAASRPDYPLDKELEERGAYASAEPYND